MKSWLASLLIAISMYSVLPVKCMDWTPRNLRHAMAFFPLVGVFCGSGVWLVWMLCTWLHIGAFLFAVIAVLSTIGITGGIHLDGFCDTADALYSRRPQAEKLQILKDPHCGPFAVFSVILVLLVEVGAYTELYTKQDWSAVGLLTGGFVLVRCLSGLSVTCFPCTPTSSLAKTFGQNAAKSVSWILLSEICIVGILLFLWYRWIAIVLIGAILLVFWGYYRMQKRQFGGITGDLAGYFLVLGETAWLLCMALFGGVL